MFLDWSWLAVRLAGPIALVTMVVGFASQLVQVGFLTSSEPLKPQLKRIDPISGFQRIFSKRALVELLKATLKVTLVGALAYGAVRSSLGEYTEYMKLGPAQAAIQTGRRCFASPFGLAFACWSWRSLTTCTSGGSTEQSLRMSRRELKEELRQTEGDPQIRGIRQRQRQLASSRMMAKVPTADVVITNPVHLAVALKYDPVEMDAPTVVAKGAGPLARRIKEVAREHGVTSSKTSGSPELCTNRCRSTAASPRSSTKL